MNGYTLVVLSRYPDLFYPFREMVDRLLPNVFKILIRSGRFIDPPHDIHWLTRDGKEPFVYSRNLNLGWEHAGRHDVLLSGDDIRISTPEFGDILQEIAYSDPKVGVSTIQLYGQSPFVCGYFKREVLDRVGKMDERYVGYGRDDMDFCRRMEALGYSTVPTERIKANHGGGTSFLRRTKELGTDMEAYCNINNKLFNEKWEQK